MSIEKHITMKRIITMLAMDSQSTLFQYAALGFLEMLERSKQYGSSVSEFAATKEAVSQSLVDHAQCLYEELCDVLEDNVRNDVEPEGEA
jgi:hypothetical protein